jgi:hypothetical protein
LIEDENPTSISIVIVMEPKQKKPENAIWNDFYYYWVVSSNPTWIWTGSEID